MWKLAPLVVVVPLVAGCLDSSGSSPAGDAGLVTPVIDSGLPGVSTDGSVVVEGGVAEAGAHAELSTGLGAGAAITHSPHFTLVTKTGGSPGGAGVKSSGSFKVISGVAPASK